MTPLEFPPDNRGGVACQHSIPVAPRGVAEWAGYFLTLFSLLLPGYSFLLIQLRYDIHEFSMLGVIVLLASLYVALTIAFACTWGFSRRFPLRGAVSLLISLLLLPRVIHFLFTYV